MADNGLFRHRVKSCEADDTTQCHAENDRFVERLQFFEALTHDRFFKGQLGWLFGGWPLTLFIAVSPVNVLGETKKDRKKQA